MLLPLLLSGFLSILPGAHADEDPREANRDVWASKSNVDFNFLDSPIYGPKECTPKANEVRELYEKYAYGSFKSESEKKLKARHDAILSTLASIDPESECSTWVNGFYALLAINGVTGGRQLFYSALGLYYGGRLRPLTPWLRNKWGGRWNSGPVKVIGAYQCEDGLIYFDPLKRPYNLAGVVAHELDHLYRDKYAYGHKDNRWVKDVATTLLLDETLATLRAGSLQLNFQQNSNRSPNYPRAMLKKSWVRLNPDAPYLLQFFKKAGNGAYLLGGDLNLFNPDGNLYHLWLSSLRSKNLSRYPDFSDFIHEILAPIANGSDPNQKQLLYGIFRTMSDGYFAGHGPSPEAASAELARWAAGDAEPISPLDTRMNAAWKENYSPEGYRKAQDELDELLLTPSAGCLKISKAIREGEASTYMGAKLGASTGGEGNRTGGEGNRTGGEGNRTGGEGNRTGGEGNRTGGEGNRTGGDVRFSLPLMPCLEPSEKI